MTTPASKIATPPTSISDSFDNLVEEKLVQIENLRAHYVYGNGKKIQELFQTALLLSAKDITSHLTLLESDQRATARNSAASHYVEAINMLTLYTQDYQNSAFNPRTLLSEYIKAYKNYADGCLAPIDTLLPHDELATQNAGQHGCPALEQADSSFLALLKTAFPELPRVVNATPHHYYFSAGFSPISKLLSQRELPNYENHYMTFEINSGYFYNLENSTPAWFKDSGPLIEGSLHVVTGNYANLGSHLYALGIRGGWEQALGKYFFISPQLGAHLTFNFLNFGTGFPLEEQTSLALEERGLIGAKIPAGETAQILISGGAYFRHTLLGKPKYSDYGPLITLTYRGSRTTSSTTLQAGDK